MLGALKRISENIGQMVVEHSGSYANSLQGTHTVGNLEVAGNLTSGLGTVRGKQSSQRKPTQQGENMKRTPQGVWDNRDPQHDSYYHHYCHYNCYYVNSNFI